MGIVENKMKNPLKNYRLLVEIGTNTTSDQNTTDINNIKAMKAQDAAHGALEDERFTLIPSMKADFLRKREVSPRSMKVIKKRVVFPFTFFYSILS